MGIKKAWTLQEDNLLKGFVEKNKGKNWKFLQLDTGLQRTEECGWGRWHDYLRPGLKTGPFDANEEILICKQHATLGNHWTKIAKMVNIFNEFLMTSACHLKTPVILFILICSFQADQVIPLKNIGIHGKKGVSGIMFRCILLICSSSHKSTLQSIVLKVSDFYNLSLYVFYLVNKKRHYIFCTTELTIWTL